MSSVTVTGSRLRNREFVSADPVQVVDAAKANLAGFTDVAQLLQSTTVAGNGTQINNNFSGFVVNGGPGVNTVGLRGTNPDRTLVMLDGKRLGPAGTQGGVGAVDLNTLPSALIDHIDILKDGSSSIYGSDAVEGVVNIITKKNFDGGDFRATTTPSVGGGGNETDVSGSFGKTFERGYITLSGDFYRQDVLRLKDRQYLDCVQDLAFDPTTGAKQDLIDPQTGHAKCQNQLGGLAIDEDTGFRYTVTPNAPASAFAPAGLTHVRCVVLTTGECVSSATSGINVPATRASFAQQPDNTSPYFLDNSAVSPVTRWTATISGAYDVLPKYAQVYSDFLFNQRLSNQIGTQQLFPFVPSDNPSNPLAALGDDAEPIVSNPSANQQRVNYIHEVLGVRGDLPDFGFLKNWRYDLSGVYSRSDGSYRTDFIQADRMNAVTSDSACDVNSTIQGQGLSMAQVEPGVACMPVNWARATQANALTTAEKNFLMSSDTGHTVYDQTYVEGDFNGDLFKLPAGVVSADVGFHLRRDHIDDVPGPQTLAGNLYNLAGAGITAGGENVQEGFGEIGIPVAKNLPLIHNLSVDVSGRYSHYSTAGDAKTYKASVRWDLTSWLGVKYNQGTSFRAPALFEIYQAASQGFLNQTDIDPCVHYLQQNSTIAAHCAAQGIPSTYAGNTPSAEVTSSGGGATLKPETSFSKTIGIVLRPKLPTSDFTIGAEIDYYQNTISDTITQFGADNIIKQCYNQTTFPNGFCNLFTRNLDPGQTQFQITQVSNNYLNVGQFIDRGIDLTIHATAKLPYNINFALDSYHSWTLQETTELLPGTVVDANGTVGTPRYVGNFNLTFRRENWTFNWFISMVGPSNDDKLGADAATADIVPSFAGTGLQEKILIKAPFYTVSNLAIQRELPRWNARILLGVNNVFNASPPAYSDLGFESVQGSVPVASQYDLIGRAVRMQFDKKF